jgi:hypothetical protein
MLICSNPGDLLGQYLLFFAGASCLESDAKAARSKSLLLDHQAATNMEPIHWAFAGFIRPGAYIRLH